MTAFAHNVDAGLSFVDIITKNRWLRDDHIDKFAFLLHKQFGYAFNESWRAQVPEFIQPIPPHEKHIQLLHSFAGTYGAADAVSMNNGHWICTYYDTHVVHIFDSGNNKVLHDHHLNYLKYLYPTCSVETNGVVFHPVQKQPNNVDCGVFAIAFAVSLAFGDNPENMRYDISQLRKHLLQIFSSETITLFPTIPFQRSHSIRCLAQIHLPEKKVVSENIPLDAISVVRNVSENFVTSLTDSTERGKKRSSDSFDFKKGGPLKFRKRKKCFSDIPSLSEEDKNIISRGSRLTDVHMEKFGILMAKYTNYTHCPTLYLQNPELIEPISMWEKHIQILHSRYSNDDLNHWVCSHYDSKKIYIYDSMNSKELHADHLKFLTALYPFYDLNNKTVIFPDVQNQRNGTDCGVFAIAFAVSILYNQKPELFIYDCSLMRKHLYDMLEKNTITHFPATSIGNFGVNILPLEDVRKNEIQASRMRRSRYEKKYPNNTNYIHGEVLKCKHIIISKNVADTQSTDSSSESLTPVIDVAKVYRETKADLYEKIVINDCTTATNGGLAPIDKVKLQDSNSLNKFDSVFLSINNKEVAVAHSVDSSSDSLTPVVDVAKVYRETKADLYQKMVVKESANVDNGESRSSCRFHRGKSHSILKKKHTRNNKKCAVKAKRLKRNLKCSDSSIEEIDKKKKKSNDKQYIFCTKLSAEQYIEKLSKVILTNRNTESTHVTMGESNVGQSSDIDKTRENKEVVKAEKTHAGNLLHNANNLSADTDTKNDGEVMEMEVCETTVQFEEIVVDQDDNKSDPESRLLAEKIVKWAMYQRGLYIKDLIHLLRVLNRRAEDILNQLPVEKDQRADILCGDTLHSASSEPYFYEMSYSLNVKDIVIVMNNEGKATNILPLLATVRNQKKNIKQWNCIEHCKLVTHNVDILDNYEKLLNKLKILNAKNVSMFCRDMFLAHSDAKSLGHPLSCYTMEKNCSSMFTAVEVLSSHFPKVRTLKRLIYKVNHAHKNLFELDELLDSADYEKLSAMTDEVMKVARSFYKDNAEICLDEEEIMKQNHAAFLALTKRTLDTPHLICISCRKLCFKSKGSCISGLRKPIDNKQWAALLAFLDEKQITRTDFICKYCLDKFRNTIGSPTCILNNLYVVPVPNEIAVLNDCERMLTQRAKAFQVIQRMGTVAKKNMPNHMKIPKAVGCTFYLPLPIEETLKKICPPTAAINSNQEFYILVNGLPTKSNKVWQNLVDLQKVFQALKWLKENNPHYSEIMLPDGYGKLLDNVNLDDVEFQVEENNDERDESENSELDVDDRSNNEESLQKNIEIDLDLAKSADNIAGELYTEPSDNLSCQEKANRSAFLTQIRDRNSYFESYTIYPLHNKRNSETATNLYQMKKVRDAFLDNRLATLELLCFPELYPSGINGQHQERALKLTDQSYVQLRLLSEESRYRLNQQYIFHLLYETNIRQLNAGIYHALNIINPRQKYTAQGYLDQLKVGALEGNLNTIFERLRNSAAYWKTPKSNLNCMIRYYGPATWFLTLSPSEWLWADLIKYIRDVNSPHFIKFSESECIARDPVSVSRFLDNKFHAMMDFLLSASNPIGKISHYFWRREYQGRGTQHFHLILWVEDAPVMGINSNEDVRKFITKYVTCRLPNMDVSPVMHRRVNTHQRHNHNSYCLRTKKEKSGAIVSRCRFGFPRPISENFVLRDPAVSIVGRRQLKTKSRLYDLPRASEQVFLNDYNPAVLCAWEGNMDIQYIGEKSTLLTNYCTKYVTKPETATVSDCVHDINSTKSLYSRIWSFAHRSLSHREIGALEAVDTLLSIPLHGTDIHTTIRWVDVNMIRNRKLKPRKDVENLNPDSTEIFCPSLVDNHYPNRPKELEATSLYEFATWYDIVKVVPKNEDVEIYEIGPSLFLKKRSRGYLINHYRYNVNTQPENYFYALLLLYQPWRITDELKEGFNTYVEAFAAKKDILKGAAEYNTGLIGLQQGLDNIQEQIEKLESDDKNKVIDSDSDADDNAVKDFADIAEKAVIDRNVPEMIAQLNADQGRIFECVRNALTSNDRILRLCISGEGGTGKSRLIDTIRCWTKQVLKKETAVTAPTGIAAFNISGLTVHKAFQLPVEHGSIPKYSEMSDAALKVLRLQFKDVILIIIDEISMISNVTLLYINQRLIEIFNTADVRDGWFGNMHMVVFGDFLQLPPVLQDPVYQNFRSSVVTNLMGSLGNVNLWKELFTYDELRINMRQKTDQSYGDLLSRLRVGAVTSDDIKLLQQRLIKIDTSLTYENRIHELCNYINKLPDDTVVLLPTCQQCDLLNFEMLKAIPLEEIRLTAEDNINCPKNVSKKAFEILRKLENDSSSTAGLERVIVIKLGARIMIRRNIDISRGLVNGAICRVMSVLKKNSDNRNIESITIRLSNGHECVLERASVKFQIMNGAYVIRKQFPISLSYGITIHKSQGLSLQNAVVDAGNGIFTCGQTYVALSRVTTLQGLHLINFDPQNIKANVSAIEEYNRLRMIHRSDLPQIDIPHKRWARVPDFSWSVAQQDPNPESYDHVLESEMPAEWIIRGLQNKNGVYSYVNATLQCIFHSSVIRKHLLKKTNVPSTILATTLKAYLDNSTDFISTEVRQFTGGAFSSEYEQDPASFLETLLSKTNHNDDIGNFVRVRRNCTERCKRCNYAFNTTCNEYTLLVPLHSDGRTIILQQLINDFYSHWHDYDGFCRECSIQTEMSRKISIEAVNDIVIIKLDLFTNKGRISAAHGKGFLKAIPTSTIAICNNLYRVISGIFTCDESIKHGHWQSLLRVGKTSAWVAADDQNVKKVRWPINSRAAYILFLQNIKTK